MKNLNELTIEALGLVEGTKITSAHLALVKMSIDDKGEITVAKLEKPAEDELANLKKTIEDKDARIAELSKTGDVSQPVREMNIQLKKENKDLQDANDKLELDAKTNDVLIKLGKDHQEAKAKEAIDLYKKQMGEKSDENVIKLIKDAKPEQLDGLLALHVKGATEKFAGHCAKCGSNEFSFRSTLVEGGDNPGGEGTVKNEDKDFMRRL